jgi:Pentapeptide repeats (8 copies)
MSTPVPLELGRRGELRADCARCVGLCCVALAFARSADFAFDKAAGEPCLHLQPDDLCRIHPELRERGFRGCTAFDCFGAGQKVTQQLFGGVSWRNDPSTRAAMFAAFPVVRALHELLWLLDEARSLPAARPIRDALDAAFASTERLTLQRPDRVAGVDIDAARAEVGPLLAKASALARARYPTTPATPPGPRRGPRMDLVGADLRNRDLRGADLRGALLIAADLSGADLRGADLLGADLRDADLSHADLSEALFLTQVQANAARGSAATRLPPALVRPGFWNGSEHHGSGHH